MKRIALATAAAIVLAACGAKEEAPAADTTTPAPAPAAEMAPPAVDSAAMDTTKKDSTAGMQ